LYGYWIILEQLITFFIAKTDHGKSMKSKTLRDKSELVGIEILGPAAVFKGSFSIDWIQEITGAKASIILSVFNQGMDHNWLKPEKEGFYSFSNENIKKRFWQTVSIEEREKLHRRAAEIIAEELPLEDESDLELVDHLLQIKNDKTSCGKLLKAGNRARKSYQLEKAKEIYQKILLDLSSAKGESEDQLFTDTAIQYSKITTPADTFGVIDILKDAIKRAQKRNLSSNLCLLRMHLAKQEWLLSNFKVAFHQFNTGWELAKSIDNPNFKRSVNIFSVFFRYWQGRFKDVVADYEKFAPAVSELPKSEFSMLANLTIGACLGNSGQIYQGIGMMDVIRRHCEETGNSNLASHALAVLALFLVDLKRFEEAIPYYQEAMESAIKGHNNFIRVFVHLGLAHVYYLTGKKENAIEELGHFLALRKQQQILATPFPLLLELCYEVETGWGDFLPELSIEFEIQQALKSENVYMQGMAVFYQALFKNQKGAAPQVVIRKLQKALKLLEDSGHFIGIENCRLELARISLQNGDKEKGIELASLAVKQLLTIDRKLIPGDFSHLVQDQDAEKELLKEILALGQELAVIRDPRDLVNRIITTVNRIIGAERGAIFLVYEKGEKISLKAAKNITNDTVKSEEFSKSMELIWKTVRTKREQITRIKSETEFESKNQTFYSVICIPMLLRNQIVGVLYSDIRINKLSLESLNLEALKYFAAQAAIMLENAQAYQALQEQYQKEKEEKRYLEQQFKEEFHFEEIIGRSQAIKSVFTDIDSVAATDSAVLILGETGVGKELVARAIHRSSNRKKGPFIKVNSSALSEFLISSELFGHEKGAFTGAVEQKIGRFELANGGTLFLDEIGDVSQTVQLQLLRVLQTKEFERVGGRSTIRSDFRLMAATNKDLRQEIQKGKFRLDLYYRLNVFPINVPPLVNRKEDIPLLAFHFLKIYTKKLNKKIDTIPGQVIDKMVTYKWPGNVRELENFIERGTILSRNNRFNAPPIEDNSQLTTVNATLLSHQDNERQHILNTLRKTNGKIAGKGGAAELLRIHPNTLRYRMKKLNIKMGRTPD